MRLYVNEIRRPLIRGQEILAPTRVSNGELACHSGHELTAHLTLKSVEVNGRLASNDLHKFSSCLPLRVEFDRQRNLCIRIPLVGSGLVLNASLNTTIRM